MVEDNNTSNQTTSDENNTNNENNSFLSEFGENEHGIEIKGNQNGEENFDKQPTYNQEREESLQDSKYSQITEGTEPGYTEITEEELEVLEGKGANLRKINPNLREKRNEKFRLLSKKGRKHRKSPFLSKDN